MTEKQGRGRPTFYKQPMPEPGFRVRLPQPALDWLEAEAERKGVKKAQIIRDLVDRERGRQA